MWPQRLAWLAHALGLLAIIALLGACARAKGADDPSYYIAQSTLMEGVSFNADSNLSREEQRRLGEDLTFASSLRVRDEGDGLSTYYRQAFGEAGTGLPRYLDPRINYVISSDSEFYSSPSAMDSSVQAVNWSMSVWINALSGSRIEFEGKPVPVGSTRVGIVQLGPGYSNPSTTRAMRLATLVHEARHSDCPGGITSLQADRIAFGEKQVDVAPRCSFPHSVCPSGHDYAGLEACDPVAWGAYSVQAVFALNLYKRCDNCDEADRQAALVTALDRMSRFEGFNDALDGKYGSPDMSSSGIR